MDKYERDTIRQPSTVRKVRIVLTAQKLVDELLLPDLLWEETKSVSDPETSERIFQAVLAHIKQEPQECG